MKTFRIGLIFFNRVITRGALIWPFRLLKCHRNSDLLAAYNSCSLVNFLVYCLVIWLIIEHNLCFDLRLSCNLNFDHSGSWLTDLCLWFLLLTLRRFSTLKFYVSSFSVFLLLPLFVIALQRFLQVGEIIIPCLLFLLSYYFTVLNFPLEWYQSSLIVAIWLLEWWRQIQIRWFVWTILTIIYGRKKWRICYLWRNCIFLCMLLKSTKTRLIGMEVWASHCLWFSSVSMLKIMFIITLLMRKMQNPWGRRLRLCMLLVQESVNYIYWIPW